jgi:uncharacterized membrane protein required for colicin V production
MPPLDYLMIIIVLAFVIYGVLVGVVRQLLLLISIYGAAVLAGTGYTPVVGAVKLIIGDSLPGAFLNGLAMMLIFLLAIVLLYIGLGSVFTDTRLAGARARKLDTVFGGLLGLVSGALFAVAFYATLAFIVQASWPTEQTTRHELLDEVNSSVLQPAMANQLPFLYSSLRPWFPRGLPGFPTF